MKTRMVVGFLFAHDDDGDEVLLIRKIKPTWQAGKLNGIGGKIEPGENAWQAMRREFKEETGLTVEWSMADYYCTLAGYNWQVDFFRRYEDRSTLLAARTMTPEGVERVRVKDLLRWGVIPNLAWLIPYALDDSSRTYELFNFSPNPDAT